MDSPQLSAIGTPETDRSALARSDSAHLMPRGTPRAGRSGWEVRSFGVRLAVALVIATGLSAGSAVAQKPRAPEPAPDSPLSFWATLGDTTLTRVVASVVEANPTVRAAGARVEGARAARREAALDLTPSVTASSGYSVQQLSSANVPGAAGRLPDQQVWDAGVRMSWELDVFGRGRRTLQGRNALIDAAEEITRDVEVELAGEAAAAYFDLRGAEERLAYALQNAENQRRTLQLTMDRLEAGRGTALDTDRAQAQLSATLAGIPDLETAIAVSRHRLAALMGQTPSAESALVGRGSGLGALPDLPSAVDREAVLVRRADVRSSERQVAAGSAFTAAARAEYLPRISIQGTAGYTARALDAFGNSGTPRYAVGPVITWPLLDLGRVRAGVDAARATEAEATARHEQVVLRALEEAENALVGYRNARSRLEHLEAAAAASERATELARLRFEEGATGFLEVLDAERSLLEAQDRLAVGRAQAARALVAVYKATGGGWPRPVE